MKKHDAAPNHTRRRCPPARSGHARWPSCRCARGDRAVAGPLAERGAVATGAAACPWCRTCGRGYANAPRGRRVARAARPLLSAGAAAGW